MTKIEALIATGRYMAALELMGKMQYFAEVCHRPYIKMKLELLAAIIDYRTGRDKWDQDLQVLCVSSTPLSFCRDGRGTGLLFSIC